jgi:hypothetical protein
MGGIMSRHKGSKNRIVIGEHENGIIEDNHVEKEEVTDNENETVSIYEASQQLQAPESTIKVWVSHGHLTSINGRIPVRSIAECRFNTRRFV